MSAQSAPLHLFKEQLENESRKLAEQLGLTKRGDSLIWWYFRSLKRYDQDKINEIICDGGGDLGIDAIDIDSNDHVHFYQFKNPELLEKPTFDSGDIDRVLAGLSLILNRKHDSVANEELKSRIEEIYQIVPSGYSLHIVTSSISSLSKESQQKLNGFVQSLNGMPTYIFEDLAYLWDAFYTSNLPTLDDPLQFSAENNPYPVKSSDHESFVFHLNASTLAEAYVKYGERLLQQNIRVSAGDNATNKAIYATCAGTDSGSFFHFNNGVTFLCDSASYDFFTKRIELRKAQVVNGGQTIRVLAKAHTDKRLKPDVVVLVRIITSSGNKEFANDVAVNLNNQTRVDSSFLKSNDPKIVQLANSLAAMGWYLERREGELEQLTPDEAKRMEAKIGANLNRVRIPLKDGAQSYVATYLREPELAKKNAKKIFVDRSAGGFFERVFDSELTAEKFVAAYTLKKQIDAFVEEFGKLKRRKSTGIDWMQEYSSLLGTEVVKNHSDVIDQVIPQCAVFVSSLLFWKYTVLQKQSADALLTDLDKRVDIIAEALKSMIDFAKSNPGNATKSWPTLLKSQTFFNNVVAYETGRTNKAKAVKA